MCGYILCTTVYTVCGVLLYHAALPLYYGVSIGVPEPCPPLDDPDNGVVDITDDVATYSCAPNYRLVGDAMRTCVDGEWSGDAPSCILSK